MLLPNTIKAAYGAKHSVKRVGRGNASGHGTSSTRGGKGQTARSGGSKGLRIKAMRRLMQSAPKLRGFKSMATRPAEVYLGDLETFFNAGDIVTVAALVEKNLVNTNVRVAKIVGTGELKKKLTVSGLKTTKSATEAIVKAGGEIK